MSNHLIYFSPQQRELLTANIKQRLRLLHLNQMPGGENWGKLTWRELKGFVNYQLGDA